MEAIVLFIKGLPAWLSHVVEVLIVSVLFSTALLFLWGFYVGIRMVGGKQKAIKKINILPPSIEFYDESDDE